MKTSTFRLMKIIVYMAGSYTFQDLAKKVCPLWLRPRWLKAGLPW